VFDEVTLHLAEQAQRLWFVTDASLSGVKDISLMWNLMDQLRLVHEERASVINRACKANVQTATKLASIYKAVAVLPEEPNLDRAWESGKTPCRTLPRSPYVKGVETLVNHLFPDAAGSKGRDRR
jgi:MinD-like ATPase involved in chromosome partitioning or flagellar assembly